jgi:signal transduction histidine kinase
MHTLADSFNSESVPPQPTRHPVDLSAWLALATDLIETSGPEPSSDLPAALDAMLARLARLLPQTDLVWLLRHDPSSKCLRVLAAAGDDTELMRQITTKVGESISGKVFQEGRPYLLETRQAVAEVMGDLAPHNRELFVKLTGGRIPHSTLAVPLTIGECRLGVLVMQSLDTPSGFSAQDQLFAQAVASLLALAIDRAQLQDEVKSMRADEKASQTRADILSVISHELRTPLASIKGYSTALLLDEVEWDETRRHEFLELIDEECDALEEIIRDVLDAARIDAGRLEIEWQPVMLPRLAQVEVEDISRRTTTCDFVLDFPTGFPVIDADPIRIGQVLRNLLDNAVKYSPQGGLIVVRGVAKDDEVVISVSDQGVGIAPQDLNQLFDRFFRVKASTGRHVPGSGLGLPISQSIVETHGGRIWAESQLGHGATLYFTLPRTGLSADLDKE